MIKWSAGIAPIAFRIELYKLNNTGAHMLYSSYHTILILQSHVWSENIQISLLFFQRYYRRHCIMLLNI